MTDLQQPFSSFDSPDLKHNLKLFNYHTAIYANVATTFCAVKPRRGFGDGPGAIGKIAAALTKH
jgi:hypothetical protein